MRPSRGSEEPDRTGECWPLRARARATEATALVLPSAALRVRAQNRAGQNARESQSQSARRVRLSVCVRLCARAAHTILSAPQRR